jgi:signal peptidase II
MGEAQVQIIEPSGMKLKNKVLVVLVVVFLDLLTKYFAELYLVSRSTIEVIPGFFSFTLVYNKGVAFGLFGGLPDLTRRIVLACVSILALVVVFRFMLKEAKSDSWAQFALCGILGGAVGNIVDRFRYDAVVDFLDFYYQGYHWPAFNVADSAISVGVSVLMFRWVCVK